MKFQVTFTSQLLSNLTPNMNQTSIEINGNLLFFQIYNSETFEPLQTQMSQM